VPREYGHNRALEDWATLPVLTPVDDGISLLGLSRDEVLRKRIIQIASLHSAQSGEAGILICLLDNLVTSSFSFLSIRSRAVVSTSSATPSTSCAPKAVEIWDLWSGHGQGMVEEGVLQPRRYANGCRSISSIITTFTSSLTPRYSLSRKQYYCKSLRLGRHMIH